MWSPDGPQGFESRKIKYLLPRYTRGRGLEIGCGLEKAFPHFIGIDNGHHFGKGAADFVCNADRLSMFADGSMDFVFSSHVLEHMEDPERTLAEWWRVIRFGGHLCLYLPHKGFYPNVGQPGANPDHKHDFWPEDITRMVRGIDPAVRIVEAETRDGENEYSFFLVFRKRTEEEAKKEGRHFPEPKAGKTACVCRFGGFGDMLQAAVVFPQLKAQGFHVTVMTTPKGKDVIGHDPNVDDWYIVDPDQVPNAELTAFWAEQAKRFDRFVNLSESVEGTLLALPGRVNHSWPHEVRRKRLNLNYHEWTAELAQVPFKPCRLFHPTLDEVMDAEARLDPESFNVLWALAGSSIHKFTPHQDAVIARMLLEIPEARIYLVGDDACKILEQGWEEEPRVVRLSGELSIRQTLALAQRVDLVIGPETGVLNAVGMEKSPHKVLFLSHSSANNLSKHWVNTQALTPIECPCHPCHQLHYGSEFCDTDPETGAARCALNIFPSVIWGAVEKVYRNWKKGRR